MSVSGGLESGGKFAVFAVDGTTGKLWTSTQLTDPSGYGWVALGNSAIRDDRAHLDGRGVEVRSATSTWWFRA